MDIGAQRRRAILHALSANGFVQVGSLARECGCSEMTVRRDLSRLEDEGLVERARGGAVSTRRVTLEFALEEKMLQHAAEKSAIARAAGGMVTSGQRVLLDTGTTILALARELRSRGPLQVFTCSLAAVSVLLGAKDVECTILGGTIRDGSPDAYGPLLEDTLSRMHADIAFVGCDGISTEGGLTTADMRCARAAELMLANSARSVVLADSSKAYANSFIRYAVFKDIDCLITDSGMPADVLAAAREAGVETVVVNAA